MSGRHADAPVRHAVSLQRWESLAFLHWPCRPQDVARHLPAGLVPDVVDGTAWVALTPFLMRDLRAPGVPALPPWARLAEVNVRTYVRHPATGTDGLWFLRLLCSSGAVVAGLRALGLPYVRAAGAVADAADGTRYVARSQGDGHLRAHVVPGARITAPGPWLTSVTGRWGAYTRRAGRLWRVPVEHAAWPLHEARLTVLDTDLLTSCGLPAPAGAPHVTWSPGVDARFGPPRLLPGP